MAETLVLNKSWIPIYVTDSNYSIVKLYTGAAYALHPETFIIYNFNGWVDNGISDIYYKSPSVKVYSPDIIILVDYSGIPKFNVNFTKLNIMRRDCYTCQYCGCKNRSTLTIDHVIPKCLGGKNDWINCVTACFKCNNKKGYKSLKESGLKLLNKPYKPIWNSQLYSQHFGKNKFWDQFLEKLK